MVANVADLGNLSCSLTSLFTLDSNCLRELSVISLTQLEGILILSVFWDSSTAK